MGAGRTFPGMPQAAHAVWLNAEDCAWPGGHGRKGPTACPLVGGLQEASCSTSGAHPPVRPGQGKRDGQMEGDGGCGNHKPATLVPVTELVSLMGRGQLWDPKSQRTGQGWRGWTPGLLQISLKLWPLNTGNSLPGKSVSVRPCS